MTDWHIFLTCFGIIFVAELPDKTAVAAVVLATRNKAMPVFLGTALALTVQSVVAIAAGKLLSMLPARPVHIGAGLLFLVSAIFMWRRKDEDEDGDGKEPKAAPTFWRTLISSFGVVFIAEWGDLTQLGTAALAARYARPIPVFVGATLALWAVAAIAVFIGNRAGKLLKPNVTKKVASVAFALLGIALISGLL